MRRFARWAASGLATAIALGGAVGGCSDPDPRLVQMKKVRDAVCTCADGPCIEQAMKGMPATRPDDLKEAERLGREILACVEARPVAPVAPAVQVAPAAPAVQVAPAADQPAATPATTPAAK